MADHADTLPRTLPQPELCIVLTGPGVHDMAEDRLNRVNRLVHDLGLTASLGADSLTREAHEASRSVDHTAKSLSRIQQSYDLIASFLPEHPTITKGHERALRDLFEAAFWKQVEDGVRLDRIFFGDVARTLASGTTGTEWVTASKVSAYVFMDHIRYSELEAAASIIDIWEKLIQTASSSNEEVYPRIAQEDGLNLAIQATEDRLYEGHLELMLLLQRLRDMQHRALIRHDVRSGKP